MKTDRAYSKPRRCPQCGSKKVENILYHSPPVKKSASEEHCTTENIPKWHCSGCGVQIYLKTSRRCRNSS